MRIAFVSHYCAFDYARIGGIESLVRRLAQGLSEEGDKVALLVYGSLGSISQQSLPRGMSLHYFLQMPELLDFVESANFDHVVSIYILRRDRIRYALFRRQIRDRTRFHILHAGWHPKPWGRALRRFELRVAPYNGHAFTLSPRLSHEAGRGTDRVIQIWPPVPGNYFLSPDAKPMNDPLRACFVGRLDVGKGFYEAMDVITFFTEHFGVDCSIHGIFSASFPESTTLHNELATKTNVKYESFAAENYSDEVDDGLRQLLYETDILILPYRRLSSSIDTPLLMLEGMASLCAIVAPTLGHIPEIYGESQFLIAGDLESWKSRLKKQKLEKLIQEERHRIWQRNQTQDFRVSSVVKTVRQALMNG